MVKAGLAPNAHINQGTILVEIHSLSPEYIKPSLESNVQSWLAVKDSFSPPPQFSRLGILVSLRPIFLYNLQFSLSCVRCTCMCAFVWVGITFLLSDLYSLASVLCTCISMYREQSLVGSNPT